MCEAQNTVNPNGLTSILTMPQHKILVSKSDSSLNALANQKRNRWINISALILRPCYTNEKDFKEIWEYIENNPKKWMFTHENRNGWFYIIRNYGV